MKKASSSYLQKISVSIILFFLKTFDNFVLFYSSESISGT